MSELADVELNSFLTEECILALETSCSTLSGLALNSKPRLLTWMVKVDLIILGLSAYLSPWKFHDPQFFLSLLFLSCQVQVSPSCYVLLFNYYVFNYYLCCLNIHIRFLSPRPLPPIPQRGIQNSENGQYFLSSLQFCICFAGLSP